MISTLKSYGVSILLHGMLLVALYAVPAATQRSFSASGQTQVIALQMFQSNPSVLVNSVSESLVEPMEFQEPPPAVTPIDALEPRSMDARGLRNSGAESNSEVTSEVLTKGHSVEMPSDVAAREWGEEVSVVRQSFAERALPEPLPSVDEVSQRQDSPIVNRRRQTQTAQPPVFASTPLKPDVGLEEDSSANFAGNSPPAYPDEALRRGWQGTVLLRLRVSKSGKVQQVEIVTSSGHRLLDEAAAQTVAKWSGEPASRWGRPVESVELLPIRFRL